MDSKYQNGQLLTEYAAVLVLATAVIMAVLALVGPGLSDIFRSIVNTFA